MAKPKIEVELTADAKGLKKGAKDAGEAVDKLGKASDEAGEKVKKAGEKADEAGRKMGDTFARNKADQHLGTLGEAVDDLGIDLDNVDTKLLAAGAGLAALGQVVVGGVQQWGEYTAQVRQYADAAGTSTEEASRFAEVFRQFGIEADDGIDALKTLGEEAGDAPEKFKQYNVEIVRAKDGSIDLAATMSNVAERFRTMRDPAERAAMGAALFGDNWLRIAPLLEKGKVGLDELLKSVDKSRIVTAEADKQQREFEQAMRQLQGTIQSLQLTIGREAIPKLTMLAKDLNTVSGAVENLSGDQAGLNDFLSQFNPISSIYSARMRDQRDKAEEAAKSVKGMSTAVAASGVEAGAAGVKQLELANAEQQAADKADLLKRRHEDVARAAQDAAKATETQRQQLEQLRGLVETVAGTELGYQRAVMATADAQATLAEKQKAVTDAVNSYGDASPEAKAATDDYAKSLLDAQSAADSQAKAEVERAKQVALASGQTFTAEQANIVYRDALVKVRDAANDEGLKGGLSSLIGLVDDTAASAGNAEAKLLAAAAAASRLALEAQNALQQTSQGTFVGTADSAARGTGSESVATQSLGRQSAGRQQVVNINVNTPIGNPRDVVTWMREELRKAERAQR